MGEAVPDVVVVGDVMVDVGVEAGALARGGDVHGRVRVRPGGAGANAAVWAAREGARVRLFGRVGRDLGGRLLAEALRDRGVEARLAVDASADTGAMLVVRERGERSMVADRGANARLSPHDLPARLRARALLVSGYLFFDPGSEPAARAALERAKARVVAVDAASWPLLEAYGADRFLAASRGATLLLANREEAEVLGPGAARAYRAMCVKLGPEGAEAVWEGKRVAVGVEPLATPADPTGAGDAFDGVLMAALAAGRGVREALERACRAGRRCAASLDTWPER